MNVHREFDQRLAAVPGIFDVFGICDTERSALANDY